jgi:site-specific recombinase XerD
VAYVVVNAARAAGIAAKRVSPHTLRHTYALRTLRASRNLMAVRTLLGHASVATTQRYVDHLELAELRAALAPFPAGEPPGTSGR